MGKVIKKKLGRKKVFVVPPEVVAAREACFFHHETRRMFAIVHREMARTGQSLVPQVSWDVAEAVVTELRARRAQSPDVDFLIAEDVETTLDDIVEAKIASRAASPNQSFAKDCVDAAYACIRFVEARAPREAMELLAKRRQARASAVFMKRGRKTTARKTKPTDKVPS